MRWILGSPHPMNYTFYVCGSNIEIIKLKYIVKLPVFINVQGYVCLTLQYSEYTQDYWPRLQVHNSNLERTFIYELQYKFVRFFLKLMFGFIFKPKTSSCWFVKLFPKLLGTLKPPSILYSVLYRCVFHRSTYRCTLTYKMHFFDQCGGSNNLVGDIVLYHHCVVEIGFGPHHRLEALWNTTTGPNYLLDKVSKY